MPTAVLLDPGEGRSYSLFPRFLETIASFFVHIRLPSTVDRPIRAEFVDVPVKTYGEAGGVSGSQRRSFLDGWANDGKVQDVRLKLHQKIVLDHSAIGSQDLKLDL